MNISLGSAPGESKTVHRTAFDPSHWRDCRQLALSGRSARWEFVERIAPHGDARATGSRRAAHFFGARSVAWVLANPAVSVALVGARRPEEVEANMGAIGWALTEDNRREIDGIFEAHGVETRPDIWVE